MKKQIAFLVCASLTFFAGADRASLLGVRGVSVQNLQKPQNSADTQAAAAKPFKAVAYDPTIALVKKKISAFMRRYKVPGAAVVLYTHGQAYLFHCGYADRETKLPVTQKTLFEVGSITKLFTCLLVAQEVLDGNMCLTDSIREYIPALAFNRRLKHMTLERLATHTASLPFNVPESINTKEKFLSYIARWRTPCTSSYAYLYSNPGIELLRCALEQATGESIQDLLVNRILLPLGMAPVGIRLPDAYAAQCAHCYDKAGAQTISWHHPLLLGCAALRASSVDMLAFLKAAIGLPGTPVRIAHAMRITQTPYVLSGNLKEGLCWSIRDVQVLEAARKKTGSCFASAPVRRVKEHKQVFDEHSFFDKTGTTEGFHAYIAVMPGRSKGIVVMMNRTLPKGWKIISKIGRDILFQV